MYVSAPQCIITTDACCRYRRRWFNGGRGQQREIYRNEKWRWLAVMWLLLQRQQSAGSSHIFPLFILRYRRHWNIDRIYMWMAQKTVSSVGTNARWRLTDFLESLWAALGKPNFRHGEVVGSDGNLLEQYLLCLVDENRFKYACSVMKVFLQQLGGYFSALQLPQKTAKSGKEGKKDIF